MRDHSTISTKLAVTRAPACLIVPSRSFYKSKKGPKKGPTKPLSFDYSGDLTTSVGHIDYTSPRLGFEDVSELQSADDKVKKIFSLEFTSKGEVMQKAMADLIRKVQDHPLDVQTIEVNIARETVGIRNKIKHCLQFRKDKIAKMRLIELIHKRKRLLKQLRRRDAEKFSWLTSELKLQLLPDPTPERMTLSRREKREKAAREATEALKQKKMEELRQRLAVEKAAFEKFKEAELADIEKSLKELGIGEMKSLEQTITALGMEHLLPKPEPLLTYEERMKVKKMEVMMKKKKEIDAEILRNHGFIVPRTLLS